MKLRLSELTGKEVINLSDGARLGVIEDCELSFDAKSGKIEYLILPNQRGLFSFFNGRRELAISWHSVKRIGEEVIIVDLNNVFDRMYTSLHGDEG